MRGRRCTAPGDGSRAWQAGRLCGHTLAWSKLRSSQGLPGWKGPVRVKGFQMGSVRPTSW
jgi:hypothetical protein